MGLAERRAVEEFKTANFGSYQAKINEVAGKTLELDVQWQTLGKDEWSHKFSEALPTIYFEPLIKALKNITGSDIGKSAIASGLNKVVIKDSKQHIGADGIKLEGGVLTIDLEFTNFDDVDSKVEYITKELESKL